jgi:hypothetical protein
MAEEAKSFEDDIEEFENLGDKVKILSMMRNMLRSESKPMKKVEIFTEDNNNIYPTFWYKDRQIATCRKCGKTGDSITSKKLGLGNFSCCCCFCFLCLWPCIPIMCCLVYDVCHSCPYCKAELGVKTFI